MIIIQKNISQFEGTAKELTFEFTHLLLGFKTTMMKEFHLTEEEILKIIAKCGEIAFMTVEERQEYLETLLEDIDT